MTELDFFVDFATTGYIEGIGLHSSPYEWDRTVGSDFVDDVQKKQLRRDYGLIELTFWRTDGAWFCTGIDIQAHRLWWKTPDLLPAKLQKKYGEFPRSVELDKLRENLALLDYATIPIEDRNVSEYTRYHVPKTKVLIVSLSSVKSNNTDEIPIGTVWSMSLSVNAEIWNKPLK
jgi:hypothetical protein